MGPKPFAKGDHKRWIGGQILNRFVWTNPATNEVMMEELDAKLGVIADPSALEMRASATPKMAAKGIKHVEIDVFQDTAFPLNEAAEMGGSSKVANGACRGVSLAFEVICERIDVWSTDSTAQTP
jgi:hypothetical protein